MPTSMTIAPGLIHSPRTMPRLADRDDQEVGACRRALRGRGCSGGTRWSVAPASSSSSAIGRPTMFEAPTTTAVRAARRDADVLEHLHDAVGRAGAQQRLALREAPEVVGMEAVDVLGRVDRLDDRASCGSAPAAAAAPGCRRSSDRRSAARSAPAARPAWSCPADRARPRRCRPPRRPALVAHVDLRRPDRRPPGRPPDPGRRAPRGDQVRRWRADLAP